MFPLKSLQSSRTSGNLIELDKSKLVVLEDFVNNFGCGAIWSEDLTHAPVSDQAFLDSLT